MKTRALFAGAFGALLLVLNGCCHTDRCAQRPVIVGSAPTACCPNNCNTCNKCPTGTVITNAPPPGVITH